MPRAPSAAQAVDVSASVPSAVTYTAQVRPILARACVSCHSPGQSAPFSLGTYAEAKAVAPLIAEATAARTMPPSSIDNSGQCNTFREVAWLTDDEIATLGRWSASGAPEGDTTVPAPAPHTVPTLTGEVVSLQTPKYVPGTAGGKDDYRCFVVKNPFSAPTFVTGFDTRPGDRETAHHMVVFYPMSDALAAMADALDAKDPGPGYSCYGSPGLPATILAAWAPGAGATRYPDGLGLPVVPNRPLVVQMHYNTDHASHPGEDSTRIDLQVKSAGISPAAFIQVLDLDMNLPPGQKDAEETVRSSLGLQLPQATKPLEVYGVFPHMHELGRTQRLTMAGADGSARCLFDVPRYSFNWQRMYFYDKPIAVDPKSQLSLHCRFDTTSRTEVTKWGESTRDEMCVAGLFVKL